MIKVSIKDQSVGVRPSVKLIDFIKSLDDTTIELPENLYKIYEAFTNDTRQRKVFQNQIPTEPFTEEEKKLLIALSDDAFQVTTDLEQCLKSLCVAYKDDNEDDTSSDIETLSGNERISKNKARQIRAKQREKELSKLTLNLTDMKWIHQYLSEARKSDASVAYMHEFIEGSQLILPVNEFNERNPELEARCQRLKREQEDQRYRQMTKNVDCSRSYEQEETISYQGNIIRFSLNSHFLIFGFCVKIFQSNKSIANLLLFCNLYFRSRLVLHLDSLASSCL